MDRRQFLGMAAAALAAAPGEAAARPAGRVVAAAPREEPDAVLHNPDMGWVLYENYPLDQRPGGASTLVTVPDYDFPPADAVALMFSWQDIEREPGRYDFTKVDEAATYWRKRGKQIQLRMSSESLVWWTNLAPPSGKGVPDYVLAKLPADKRETRLCEGIPYTLVDAREPYYLDRLERFLAATAAHFTGERTVTLVDLRGFGLWGEWHTGYRYPTLEARRQALVGIIDRWSAAFPRNWLSLSYSYDPDSPAEYRSGPTERYDAASTAHYQEFLRYSAFDHALTKRNVTYRRDGCGGAVHSNERRLCDEAFATLAKGPMMCEFLGGYGAAKKGGQRWVEFMVDDALSLHPNYVNLLGWQCGDARDFIRERPDLVERGLRAMGYRLVPVQVRCPESIAPGRPLRVEMDWVNRGVGRAMRDYRLHLRLADGAGKVVATAEAGALPTSRWVRGSTYAVARDAVVRRVPPGDYELRLALTDPAGGGAIALPLAEGRDDGSYAVGRVRVGRG